MNVLFSVPNCDYWSKFIIGTQKGKGFRHGHWPVYHAFQICYACSKMSTWVGCENELLVLDTIQTEQPSLSWTQLASARVWNVFANAETHPQKSLSLCEWSKTSFSGINVCQCKCWPCSMAHKQQDDWRIKAGELWRQPRATSASASTYLWFDAQMWYIQYIVAAKKPQRGR